MLNFFSIHIEIVCPVEEPITVPKVYGMNKVHVMSRVTIKYFMVTNQTPFEAIAAMK